MILKTKVLSEEWSADTEQKINNLRIGWNFQRQIVKNLNKKWNNANKEKKMRKQAEQSPIQNNWEKKDACSLKWKDYLQTNVKNNYASSSKKIIIWESKEWLKNSLSVSNAQMHQQLVRWKLNLKLQLILTKWKVK